MTDNVPAVREEAPVSVADTDSWIKVAGPVIELANRIYDTEFVPRSLRGSAPATAAAMLYGREVGLPPMTALNVTHVIEGKPGIEAEAMRAMVFAAGHEIEFVESTGARCVMRGRRRGADNWTTLEWTIDAARAAGLLGKSNWKSYPRQMLQARCSAELCRMIFPDVIHGFRTVEELDDLDAEPNGVAPSGPATRVTRASKKAAAKKSTPAPLEPRPERPDQSGPPLPGEDGYDETSEEAAPGGMGTSARGPAGSERADLATDSSSEPTPAGDVSASTGPAGTEEPAGEGEGEAPEPAGSEVPPVAPPGPKAPRLMSRAQQRGIEASLTDIGVADDREERHLIATTILGRPIESFKTLTTDDAKTLLDTFARVKDMPELTAVLDEFEARRTKEADRWNQGDRS